MEIHRLTPKDRETFFCLSKTIVKNLENKALLIPMSEEEADATFTDDSEDVVLGGFIDGTLVATLCLLHDISDYQNEIPVEHHKSKGAEIGEAMVLPEYRRQGLLNELWLQLKTFINNGNYGYILATAHPDNTASNHFINKCGFQHHTVFNRRGRTRNMYIMPL